MADKAISELISAERIKPTDLLVLEQDGAAKNASGQIFANWLTSFADGHGGIQTWVKLKTVGLVDTYRFTLADGSYMDIPVTNGRSITGMTLQTTTGLTKTYRITYNDGTFTDIPITNGRGIEKNELIRTTGLVKTYRITYNDGSTQEYTVTDGAKGDKGDNAYTWIKYAAQEPTDASHSIGDIPDAWRGEYTGTLSQPPADWKMYKWYKIKGEKGDTGDPAVLVQRSTSYMVSNSGTIVPSGSWAADIPNVPQGKYLWTRTVLTFNTGNPVTSYSVSRFGLDGTGAVNSVNGKDPDPTGNVRVNAEDITTNGGQSIEAVITDITDGLGKKASSVNGQLPDTDGAITVKAENIKASSGKTVQTELEEKQPKILSTGLLKGTGNGGVSAAAHGVDYQLPVKTATVTLSASGWSENAQTASVADVAADSIVVVAPAPASRKAYIEADVYCSAQGNGTLTFACEDVPSTALTVNVQIINR